MVPAAATTDAADAAATVAADEVQRAANVEAQRALRREKLMEVAKPLLQERILKRRQLHGSNVRRSMLPQP